MKVEKWLKFFKQNYQKKLFSLTDLQQLTGINKDTLSVQLTRLTKSGVIKRIAKKWYENPFSPPSNEEIAMVIRHPSYLSLEYALSKHNILSQTPYTLTLITIKLPYVFKTKQTVYEYHQIKKSLFWGYVNDLTINTAEPEKALLDLIYIRCIKNKELTKKGLKSMVNDMTMDEFDKKKLNTYLTKYGPGTKKILNEIKL